ncbi:hypothetical protein E2C01_053354 [Portunus trituberculatus]|uniref:Uncharacterized protein n=1 Tax=Portunus trituberculatus TaxID=210409 RepID=A0A5B7GP80_PORTR|nr:hypothetical protein [Portunus trituberculatus]
MTTIKPQQGGVKVDRSAPGTSSYMEQNECLSSLFTTLFLDPFFLPYKPSSPAGRPRAFRRSIVAEHCGGTENKQRKLY